MHMSQTWFSHHARQIGAVVLALAAVVVIAACGSSSSSSTSSAGASPSTGASTSSAASGSAVSASNVSFAKASLTAATQIPAWTAPGPALSVSSLKGKTVLIIPLTTAVSFCNQLDSSTAAVATKLGMVPKVYPTTGTPSQWASGIQQGISEHVAAIVLECAIPSSTLTPQLAAAKAAGIPVYGTTASDTSVPLPAGLTGVTTDGYYQGMKDEALSAIAAQNGKPVDALMLTTFDISTGPGMATAFKSEMASKCGSACKIKSVNIPLAQWAQQVESTVSSAMTADPNINTVAIEFDGMVPLVLPALIKYPNVGVYAYGGGEAVVKLMTNSSSPLKMDVGEGAARIGYQVMDEVARTLTHQKSVAEEDVPVRVFNASNASQEADANTGYGTSFVTGFDKLWGLGS
jgi:ribose transport system substrate-binding protein